MLDDTPQAERLIRQDDTGLLLVLPDNGYTLGSLLGSLGIAIQLHAEVQPQQHHPDA